jgi:carbon-monoxide dehydrogenase large subunit
MSLIPQLELKRKLIGESVLRLDALPKVIGKAKFTRDLDLGRIFIGKIKRCPYPHAKIIKIDTSEAEKIPGVKAIITGWDFPPPKSAHTPPLARGKVLYSNQGVAAVAAINEEIAHKAINKIHIEYEILPHVLDPIEAMKDDCPIRIKHPGEMESNNNIAVYERLVKGDLEEAFKASHIVVENTYYTSLESHVQLEPLVFIAIPNYDGSVTIYGTSSGAHKIKAEVSALLEISPDKIIGRVPFLGGWFGSKEESHVAAVAAMLALKAKGPVKLELTREETMTATGARPPSIITIKDGLTKDGRIIARKIVAIFDGGAYSFQGNDLIKNAIKPAVSVYNIPNIEVHAYNVRTNKIPGVPKRSPYGYSTAWAIECQMDYLASILKVDPFEFRLKHLLKENEVNAAGEIMEDANPEYVLKKMMEVFNSYRLEYKPEHPWKYGRGIAISAKWGGIGPHQAMVKVKEDGKIEVWAAITENGAGTTTSIAQIVAEEFDVNLEDVIIVSMRDSADSSTMGLTYGASASRQLIHIGNAVRQACIDAKNKIIKYAAMKLGVEPNKLEIKRKSIYIKESEKSIPISQLFNKTKLYSAIVPYTVNVDYFVGYGVDPGELPHGRLSPYYTHVAAGAEVLVNIETGHVKVKRIVLAQDVGRAINPKLIESQIVGGVLMGVSATLYEELKIVDGQIINANLADYKIIHMADVPEIIPVICEIPYREGPYGAKSIGETMILPVAPAIRNAIHDAIGIWINSLPITPEKILEELEKQNN